MKLKDFKKHIERSVKLQRKGGYSCLNLKGVFKGEDKLKVIELYTKEFMPKYDCYGNMNISDSGWLSNYVKDHYSYGCSPDGNLLRELYIHMFANFMIETKLYKGL